MVSCEWWCSDRCTVDFLGCDILLREDVAYTCDSFVAPDVRGQRVANALFQYRRVRTHMLGYKWTLGIVWLQNLAQRRRHYRRGPPQRRIGDIGSWGIGPWQRYFVRFDPDKVDPANPPVRIAPTQADAGRPSLVPSHDAGGVRPHA